MNDSVIGKLGPESALLFIRPFRSIFEINNDVLLLKRLLHWVGRAGSCY